LVVVVQALERDVVHRASIEVEDAVLVDLPVAGHRDELQVLAEFEARVERVGVGRQIRRVGEIGRDLLGSA
jgi:hypothetical protein